MASLAAIRKQIQRLEAQAERITKEQMSGAISQIKSLMSDFGITLEHLGASRSGATSKRAAPKKAAAKRAKRVGAGQVRYADPTTGKTWTGFGRAPAWIAHAKDRDAFLVGGKSATAEHIEAAAAAPAKRAKGKARLLEAGAAPAKKIGRAAKKVATKAKAAVKKAAPSKKAAPAKKSSPVKNARPVAKKAAPKKVGRKAAASKTAVAATTDSSGAPTPSAE